MSFALIAVGICLLSTVHSENLEIIDLIKWKDISKIEFTGKCGSQLGTGFVSKTEWFIRMFDASTKLQPGILEGNVADYGAFDECLRIDFAKDDVKGKYCLGTAKLKLPEMLKNQNPALEKNGIFSADSVQLTFALCLPDSCHGDEIRKFIPPEFANFTENNCQTKSSQPQFTTGDKLAISFFAIIVVVIIVSTGYDYYLKYKSLEPIHRLLLSFSFLSNGRSLFKLSKSPDQIQCINGIRAISIMWIMLCHMYFNRSITIAFNGAEMFEWFFKDEAMFVVGATVSVDTFFMLSGMVMVYVFLKSKPEGGFFNVPMYYLHRYLRLTPSLAVLLLVHITLIKHMGSGPLWPMSSNFMSEFCIEYWWTSLLYIQNWVNNTKLCMGATWYLSVDMQLFVISPLILFPLKKYTKITMIAIVILALASIASSFYIAWVNNLNGLLLNYNNAMSIHYIATYTRAAPWLIGTIVGYYIYEIKCLGRKFNPDKRIVLCLWIASLVVMFTCLFGGNSLLGKNFNNRPLNSTFMSLVRPSWAIALSWILVACISGYGGPVNSILSFWPFQFIAKISYNLYLLHLPIMQLFTFSAKTTTEFSPLWEIYFFWGHFCVICAIATIWTLAFESPIVILEKYLLGSNKKTHKEDTGSILIKNNTLVNVLSIKR